MLVAYAGKDLTEVPLYVSEYKFLAIADQAAARLSHVPGWR
jgi:hypothetical protein